jgi:hypothetical protein
MVDLGDGEAAVRVREVGLAAATDWIGTGGEVLLNAVVLSAVANASGRARDDRRAGTSGGTEAAQDAPSERRILDERDQADPIARDGFPAPSQDCGL